MAFKFTYFVVTPGKDIGSYIQYPKSQNNEKGNYFKFGDTNEESDIGVRSGYTTHNPDIGIFGVLKNKLSGDKNIGKRAQEDIAHNTHAQPVGNTEWFYAPKEKVWNLAQLLLKQYDEKVIDDKAYSTFMHDVIETLMK